MFPSFSFFSFHPKPFLVLIKVSMVLPIGVMSVTWMKDTRSSILISNVLPIESTLLCKGLTTPKCEVTPSKTPLEQTINMVLQKYVAQPECFTNGMLLNLDLEQSRISKYESKKKWFVHLFTSRMKKEKQVWMANRVDFCSLCSLWKINRF